MIGTPLPALLLALALLGGVPRLPAQEPAVEPPALPPLEAEPLLRPAVREEGRGVVPRKKGTTPSWARRRVAGDLWVRREDIRAEDKEARKILEATRKGTPRWLQVLMVVTVALLAIGLLVIGVFRISRSGEEGAGPL